MDGLAAKPSNAPGTTPERAPLLRVAARLGLAAVLAVALAGCVVGPDYVPPPAPVPFAFKELDGWKIATPSDDIERGDWWSIYGDETLDGLLREVDVSYYLRQEAQGLLLGPYERGARPFGVGGIPPGFGADLLPPDPERLRTIVEAAMIRVPALARAGIQRIVNGPITYTPDGNPLLGPAFGVPGYWLACGLSFGITQAGGAGRCRSPCRRLPDGPRLHRKPP